MDLLDLAQSQDIDVTNSKGEVIVDEFLDAMDVYKKTAKKERSGISLRWLLGTYDEEQTIYLIAQVLPCNIAVIEANPALKSEHTRGMMAGKFEVHYESFDGATVAGMPVD